MFLIICKYAFGKVNYFNVFFIIIVLLWIYWWSPSQSQKCGCPLFQPALFCCIRVFAALPVCNACYSLVFVMLAVSAEAGTWLLGSILVLVRLVVSSCSVRVAVPRSRRCILRNISCWSVWCVSSRGYDLPFVCLRLWVWNDRPGRCCPSFRCLWRLDTIIIIGSSLCVSAGLLGFIYLFDEWVFIFILLFKVLLMFGKPW